MSIVFNSIAFRNFGAFGNQLTEIPLDVPGMTLISGDNRDKGGSSGAGKSTVINAICYCLYDKTPSTSGKEKLINNINNNTKNTEMEVIITFVKDDQDTYVIRRTRGASVSISITKNGDDDTDAGIHSANEKIEGIIGLSFELFIRVIVYNGNAVPFLDLPVSNQRAESEELLKVTLLSQKAVVLKEEIKVVERDIDIQKAIIAQQELQQASRTKQLKDATDRVARWEADRAREIEMIDRQLARIANVDFENEELLHVEIVRLRAEQLELQGKKAPLVKDLRSLTTEIEKLRGELAHLTNNKCPYCLQKYAAAKAKMSAIDADITKLEDMKISIDTSLASTVKLLEVVQIEINELDAIIQHKDLTELLKIKNSADSLSTTRSKLIASDNPHHEALAAIKTDSSLTIDSTRLNELMVKHEHMKFLLKLLTDKNSFIRKKIISKTMPFLNKQIAHYVRELGMPHTVIFQPDMTCEITELSRELDHGCLSGGEKLRLNLALTFAFRDVMHQLHQSVNILFADEIDGGKLGAHEVDLMIRLLKHKAWNERINIFTISHRPEFEGRCDHNIIIRKERGFSTLIDDA